MDLESLLKGLNIDGFAGEVNGMIVSHDAEGLRDLLENSPSSFDINKTTVCRHPCVPVPMNAAMRAAHYAFPEGLEILESFGANLNYQDSELGWSPLHCTVVTKAFPSFEYLLSKSNVDVNLQDSIGNSTAFLLAGKEFHDEEMLQLMLQHEALDINLKNNHGSTLLTISSESGEKVKMLLAHESIDTKYIDHKGKTAFDYAKE